MVLASVRLMEDVVVEGPPCHIKSVTQLMDTERIGDMEFANEKYAVEYIDLDIMAKFISTKDLSALVRSYNVKQLNTGVQEVTFLAECFKNLCHSIVTAKTYGLLQSSFSALSNIVLLLNLVVLDENSKEIIAASVEALLSDHRCALIPRSG